MCTHPPTRRYNTDSFLCGEGRCWDSGQSRDRDIDTGCTFKKQNHQGAREGMDLEIHQQLSTFLNEYCSGSKNYREVHLNKYILRIKHVQGTEQGAGMEKQINRTPTLKSLRVQWKRQLVNRSLKANGDIALFMPSGDLETQGPDSPKPQGSGLENAHSRNLF